MKLNDPKIKKKRIKKPPLCNNFLFGEEDVREADIRFFLQRADIEDLMKTVLRIGKEDQSGFPAAKFILERVFNPPRNGCPIRINIPSIKDINGVDEAISVAIKDMSEGRISPEETNLIIKAIEARKDSIVKKDLIERSEKIEDFLKNKND